MKHHDPSTGPISREKFAELVNAPYGEATKVIRRVDPMWGREPGEKIKWRAKFTREVEEVGVAYVQAESMEEAERLAEELSDRAIDWDVADRENDPVFVGVEATS